MGLGDVVKNGWHPEGKSGGKESWRKDFKGVNQVAGWMGRGKDDKADIDAAHNHHSKPINALQDPSTFGPPPKHRDFYGEQAAIASISTPASPQLVFNSSNTLPAPAVPSRVPTIPPRGPPIPTRTSQLQTSEEPHEKPAGPFKFDTTGLSTTNLPPPPQHHEKRLVDTAPRSPVKSGFPARTASPSLPSSSRTTPPPPPARSIQAATAPPTKPKPTLPPRTAVAGGRANVGQYVPDSPPPPYSERAGPVVSSKPPVGELEETLARMRARVDGADSSSSDNTMDRSNHPPPVPMATKPK